MLFKKNLFEMAINLAKSQHLDSDGLAQIFMQYGDHLYSKGNHDGAVQQYIRSVCRHFGTELWTRGSQLAETCAGGGA